MLVLTRTCDEEIRIGDEIVVRVLDVKGDRVRIGIKAPSEVPVHRQEVYLEIERANQESLQVATGGLEGAAKLFGGKVSTKAKAPAGRREAVHTEVSHGS